MKTYLVEEYKKINIDELPKYTSQVEGLLHIEPLSISVRNMTRIDAEYDKNKYAKSLSYYYKHPSVTITNIRLKEYLLVCDTICYSRKGELFLTSTENFLRFQDKLLIDVFAEFLGKVKIVIELGCGYGCNLYVLRNAFPNHLWLGGEYSQNAIKLASCLFADCQDIFVSYFNWYDHTWQLLENLEEKVLIFTKHSIEQLPQSKIIIPTLSKYKDKIAGVIHLEPVYELIDKNSLLGLMRRAYTLKNDYNTDLLTMLKSLNAQILRTEVDWVGENPLNPTSLIYWEFPR